MIIMIILILIMILLIILIMLIQMIIAPSRSPAVASAARAAGQHGVTFPAWNNINYME